MSKEIKFKNGSYIKVIESNESKRPTNIEYYRTTYLCKPIMNDELDLWYKLCVYYHAKTELYDRTLTDLRSPYDPTEAYIQNGIERRLSYANARNIRQFINEMAIGISEHIKSGSLNANKYRYSAQDWIDEYNRLVEQGEMDFIEMEYEKYENMKNTLPEHRGYRAKILILDDLDGLDKEEVKEAIKNAEQKLIDLCGCSIKT